MRATLAAPGTLGLPTGGYGYARALLAAAPEAGLDLRYLALPDAPKAVAAVFALQPPGVPVVVDGLSLGTLPLPVLDCLPGPLIGLCHHPLALEAGLSPDHAATLMRSETTALARCERVIVTSRTTAEIVCNDMGVSRERVVVAVPGTETAPAAVGSGGPRCNVLSVGSLTPRKRHDVLIRALDGLRDLDWTCMIVGAADRDPEHAAALSDLVTALDLGDRVQLAGAMDAAALARAYHTADIFVLASEYEGFGMAFTEAMARGLPVVGCDAGAIPEATAGAARLVPPNDVSTLRAALDDLIGDAAARLALGAQCSRAATTFARWSDTARIVTDTVRAVAT